LPKIQSILEDLGEAEALFENQQTLSGTVKVTCVPFVAHRLLLQVLPEFMTLHPKIHLELELSESFLNIIDAGFDMAVRIETPRNSDLVYRKLAPNDLVFCASPEYLQKNRAPLRSPNDLAHHQLLMLSVHRKCRFEKSELVLGEFERYKTLTCENGALLTDMAVNGQGVLVRSIWDAREHFRSGSLVQVLQKHPLETFGHIHAVVPSKRYLAPRVRAFLDFVVAKAADWRI